MQSTSIWEIWLDRLSWYWRAIRYCLANADIAHHARAYNENIDMQPGGYKFADALRDSVKRHPLPVPWRDE